MGLCAARWLSLGNTLGRCRRWAPYSRLLLGAPSRPLRLLRRRFSAATSSMAAARLRLSPPLRSLFDEPLAIGVEGLRPRQEVTLRASLEDESGEAFESRAFYRADADGRLDLSRSPALEGGGGGGGGSFSGLDPMGLLWSLQPRKKPFWRLVKRDVRRPFVLGLEVLDGHDSEARLDAAPVLAKAEHERGFLRRGVRRIPVREGKVRATLFLPPGDGPFPGIIDIYGLGGGLPEHRASLLAGYDFAVLALAYYGYEDLPETLIELHLEYFEAAVHYMLKHPMVKGPGIGLLGHSKGGDICISMACFLKGIAAIVTVNGSIANIGSVLNYKDVTIPPLSFDMKRVKIDKNTGLADITDVLDNPFESPGNQSLIPLEKAEGHFLFIVGKDDRNFKSEFFAAAASKYLQAHGREKPKIICYPGAGHYIEPPYMPMCPASKHVMVGRLVTWGGEPRAHAAAQVDAWQQIQAFFHKHLGVKQCERNSKL